MSFSRADVMEIVGLLDQLDAAELTLRTRGYALRLRRDAAGGWVQSASVLTGPQLVEPAEPAGPPAEGAPAATEPAPPAAKTSAEDSGAGLVPVEAPLTGIFYHAPRPGAPPFVRPGSEVTVDTVVGIIETMKLMTSVHAGAPGRVAEICVGDAQPAEPGEVLMRIDPER